MSSKPQYSGQDAEHDLALTNTDLANAESSIKDIYKFLPTITVAAFGVSIFVDPSKNSLLVFPAALVGIGFTLLFWSIQRDNLHELDELEERKALLERQLNRPPRQPKHSSMINEHTRCAGIFSIILSGWLCLGLWFLTGPAISLILTLVFFLAFGGLSTNAARTRVRPQQVHPPYSQ